MLYVMYVVAVQPSCSPSQFRCVRGSCVNQDRVCDLQDDCGDNSDELQCCESICYLCCLIMPSTPQFSWDHGDACGGSLCSDMLVGNLV